MFDIAIIGGGTSGLTAALYAVRAGKSTLVLERETFGGQIAFSPKVENYPAIKTISGAEFATNLLQQAMDAGVETGFEDVLGINVSDTVKITTDETEYEAKALIIASGVKHRLLGLPGEDALIGKGVSYCAVCDGAFYKGKTVAVAGGGNTALADALYLSSYCEKVYLIHRRDSFRGENRLVKLLKDKNNVEFILNSVVDELLGKTNLTGLMIKNTSSSDISKLDVDGLFVAIGQEPQNEIFKNIVKTDEAGYISAQEDCVTSCKGIFAAGDCRTKSVRQLSTAAADGAVAAIAACEYIDLLKVSEE